MGIPLHSTRGLDPHLTFCPRCGGEGTGLTRGALVKYKLPDGRILIAQAGQGGKAAEDAGVQLNNCKKLEIKEGERVPDNEPCAACKKELDAHAGWVARGGIYFKCKECNCQFLHNVKFPRMRKPK